MRQQEAVSRYDQFVKEHAAFNSNNAEFLNWLSQTQVEVKQHSEIVGDLAILQVTL